MSNTIILEKPAKMSWFTLLIDPQIKDINKVLPDKYFLRKHGTITCYGKK